MSDAETPTWRVVERDGLEHSIALRRVRDGWRAIDAAPSDSYFLGQVLAVLDFAVERNLIIGQVIAPGEMSIEEREAAAWRRGVTDAMAITEAEVKSHDDASAAWKGDEASYTYWACLSNEHRRVLIELQRLRERGYQRPGT